MKYILNHVFSNFYAELPRFIFDAPEADMGTKSPILGMRNKDRRHFERLKKDVDGNLLFDETNFDAARNSLLIVIENVNKNLEGNMGTVRKIIAEYRVLEDKYNETEKLYIDSLKFNKAGKGKRKTRREMKTEMKRIKKVMASKEKPMKQALETYAEAAKGQFQKVEDVHNQYADLERKFKDEILDQGALAKLTKGFEKDFSNFKGKKIGGKYYNSAKQLSDKYGGMAVDIFASKTRAAEITKITGDALKQYKGLTNILDGGNLTANIAKVEALIDNSLAKISAEKLKLEVANKIKKSPEYTTTIGKNESLVIAKNEAIAEKKKEIATWKAKENKTKGWKKKLKKLEAEEAALKKDLAGNKKEVRAYASDVITAKGRALEVQIYEFKQAQKQATLKVDELLEEAGNAANESDEADPALTNRINELNDIKARIENVSSVDDIPDDVSEFKAFKKAYNDKLIKEKEFDGMHAAFEKEEIKFSNYSIRRNPSKSYIDALGGSGSGGSLDALTEREKTIEDEITDTETDIGKSIETLKKAHIDYFKAKTRLTKAETRAAALETVKHLGTNEAKYTAASNEKIAAQKQLEETITDLSNAQAEFKLQKQLFLADKNAAVLDAETAKLEAFDKDEAAKKNAENDYNEAVAEKNAAEKVLTKKEQKLASRGPEFQADQPYMETVRDSINAYAPFVEEVISAAEAVQKAEIELLNANNKGDAIVSAAATKLETARKTLQTAQISAENKKAEIFNTLQAEIAATEKVLASVKVKVKPTHAEQEEIEKAVNEHTLAKQKLNQVEKAFRQIDNGKSVHDILKSHRLSGNETVNSKISGTRESIRFTSIEHFLSTINRSFTRVKDMNTNSRTFEVEVPDVYGYIDADITFQVKKDSQGNIFFEQEELTAQSYSDIPVFNQQSYTPLELVNRLKQIEKPNPPLATSAKNSAENFGKSIGSVSGRTTFGKSNNIDRFNEYSQDKDNPILSDPSNINTYRHYRQMMITHPKFGNVAKRPDPFFWEADQYDKNQDIELEVGFFEGGVGNFGENPVYRFYPDATITDANGITQKGVFMRQPDSGSVDNLGNFDEEMTASDFARAVYALAKNK